ncbi:MAG: M28 family peptidase [Bacteroidota bacterium]
MKKIYLFVLFLFPVLLYAQTNFLHTNPLAEPILLGNYNPADFSPGDSNPLDPFTVGADVQARISADSLKSYILRLSTFENRNTNSDTVSNTFGIGAARRWVYDKFSQYSAANGNRLVVSYFQFDQLICSTSRHRNILAVLPGLNPTNNGAVLIEGHIDSRCVGVCDSACVAEGVEDNATGTALVMELARVMSKYRYNNTVVFMVTIGEEQGLYGAAAFATYAVQKAIPIRAVLNNDVIGGIICGKTSSAPSCPGLNNIDSTSVRLFSSGGYNSRNKQLARFIKLQYGENLKPQAFVPMNVRIMAPEDRTGRGGDHIPFREKGFAAMRFTSANEHGDASNTPTYTDRQHSSRDVLGVDLNNDAVVDSFFVDFNYLARNAMINGNAAAIAARGVPDAPGFTATRAGNVLTVKFDPPPAAGQTLRVAIRTVTNDWDTVYTVTGLATATFPCNPSGALFVSLANTDEWGAESLFGQEKVVTTATGTLDLNGSNPQQNIRLFQNRPNPFDEATWISFWVEKMPVYQEAMLQISDMKGNMVQRIPVSLRQGMNEILYTHGYGQQGAFVYTLLVDGQPVDSRQMIFAN